MMGVQVVSGALAPLTAASGLAQLWLPRQEVPGAGTDPCPCHCPFTVPRAQGRGEIPHLEAHIGSPGQGVPDEEVLQSPGNPSMALYPVPSVLLLVATCWQVLACR